MVTSIHCGNYLQKYSVESTFTKTKHMKLTQKTILITGGGSGLGAALARLLAAQNTVIICGRNEEKLKNIASRNAHIEYCVCDISNPDEIDRLFEEISHRGRTLDVLINNAGVVEIWDIVNTELPSEAIFKKINSNLAGAIAITSRFIRQADRRVENFIVNVTSEIALFPIPMLPLYSTSKAGLHTFTLALRAQLRDENFSVIEILPPGIDTDMPRQLGNTGRLLNADDFAARIVKSIERKTKEFAPGANVRLFKMLRAFFPLYGVNLLDTISRKQLRPQ